MRTAVKDIMTTHVISVQQDAPFAAVAAALREYRVGAFPVVNQAGQVIGVVSEGDLLAKQALGAGEDNMPSVISGILKHEQLQKARAVTAGELMTVPPVTISPEDTVQDAARLMYLHRVKHLPVVDAHNHLAGIISRADVLSAFDRADDDIRREVIADVALDESRADPDMIEVSVKDGIVTLSGKARTSAIAHEIVRRVRHIQGVVAVRDRMDYPPPGPAGFDVLARFASD